jgi:hypothetical protein
MRGLLDLEPVQVHQRKDPPLTNFFQVSQYPIGGSISGCIYMYAT